MTDMDENTGQEAASDATTEAKKIATRQEATRRAEPPIGQAWVENHRDYLEETDPAGELIAMGGARCVIAVDPDGGRQYRWSFDNGQNINLMELAGVLGKLGATASDMAVEVGAVGA